MGSKRDPTKSGKPGPQGPSGTLQKSKNKKTGMWGECCMWVDSKCMEFVVAGWCTGK